MNDLIAVINGWGVCAVLPADYSQVPHFAAKREPYLLLRHLLHDAHETPTSLMMVGDSRAHYGGGAGNQLMAALEYYSWLIHGHTPGTSWSKPMNYGSPAGNAQWLHTGGEVGSMAQQIPNTYLPPGYLGVACWRANDIDGYYFYLQHRNENGISETCADPNSGFMSIREARLDLVPDLGNAAFAAGSMEGGRSLINANPSNGGGLFLEVVAAAYPGGPDRLSWVIHSRENYCTTGHIYSAPLASGTLLGAATNQSLNAPLGTAYRASTRPLPVLSGADLVLWFAISS